MPVSDLFFLPEHPADDPGLDFQALLYTPDDQVTYPPPWPFMVGCHAGGFNTGGIGTLQNPFYGILPDGVTPCGMAYFGYACLAFDVRVMKGGTNPDNVGLMGQTTDGRWHQPTDDYLFAMNYARNHPQCNGFVAGLGGSGSGHHAMYRAIVGVPGDTKLDGCIAMSPVTDYSDREPDVSVPFKNTVNDYNRMDPANDPSFVPENLPVEFSRTPLGLLDATMAPTIHFNGDSESMPLSQLLRFQDAANALNLPLTQYNPVINTGMAGGRHSFAMWNTIFMQAIAFMDATVQAWLSGGGGGGGGGGEVITLTKYIGELLGGPGSVPNPIAPTATSVQITGLAPSTAYTFKLTAYNVAGPGPTASTTFTSDGPAGSKIAPKGVYVWVTSGTNDLGNLTLHPWWEFDYVSGVRVDFSHSDIEPASGSLDWTKVDELLNLCATYNKKAVINLREGIYAPQWLKDISVTYAETGPFPGTLCVPWSPQLGARTKSLVKAFATRYSSNTNLGYILVNGMGQTEECVSVQAADFPTLQSLAFADGYTTLTDGVLAGLNTGRDAYWTGLKNFATVIALNLPIPTGQAPPETSGDVLLKQFVDGSFISGIGGGQARPNMGLIHQYLTAQSVVTETNLALINTYKDVHPIVMRTRYVSTDPRLDSSVIPYVPLTGLTNAINNGIALGLTAIEIPEEDINNVTTGYVDLFTATNDALLLL